MAAASQTVLVAAPFVSLAATVGPVAPASVAAGKSGSVLVTVTNNGNEDAVGPLGITLSASSDGLTPLAGATLATLMKRTKIPAGRSGKFRLRFKVTTAVAAGSYFPFASLAGASTTAAGPTQFTAG